MGCVKAFLTYLLLIDGALRIRQYQAVLRFPVTDRQADFVLVCVAAMPSRDVSGHPRLLEWRWQVMTAA